MSASISSDELKTGNLWVRIERSMIPADHTSIAEWHELRMNPLAFPPTDSLVWAFEQNFRCSEPPCTRSVRLNRWPFVILQKPNTTFAQLRPFACIVYRLLDNRGLGSLDLRALKCSQSGAAMLTRRLPWRNISLESGQPHKTVHVGGLTSASPKSQRTPSPCS